MPQWPKLTFMKNNPLLTSILLLCLYFAACSKNSGKLTPQVQSSVTFSANGSFINFLLSTAFIQDVYSVHTTLITGQYQEAVPMIKTGGIPDEADADTAPFGRRILVLTGDEGCAGIEDVFNGGDVDRINDQGIIGCEVKGG